MRHPHSRAARESSRQLLIAALIACVAGGAGGACSGEAPPQTGAAEVMVDANWQRELMVERGAKPRLAYAVYGAFEGAPKVSRDKHRSRGVPAGLELSILRRGTDDETLAMLQSDALRERSPEVAALIDSAPACVVVQGEVAEPGDDLLYLRDTVGLVAALCEQGGVAVFDMHAQLWLDAPTWSREFFEHGECRPQRHVQVLMSDGDAPNRAWFHTRGNVKFGRPDFSVHCVPKEHAAAMVDMLSRFAVMHAKGAQIPEGQAINMPALPPGGVCRHAGSIDDPEFNNVHVEIAWPAGSELACP